MGQTLTFDHAPDLKRLFAAALRNGRHTGSSLPEVTAERRGVEVDPSAVADYAAVCGFTLGAHPPVTWPHVLAFPLQAAVMSRSDFPVPMVGLVHLENRITWSRPLRYGERVDVQVGAVRMRPHRRGRLVDMVAEVTAGDETLWWGMSTYLARGHGDESAPSSRPPDVSDLRDAPAAMLRFDEGAGRRYARVSGDVNPIHLHALSAKAFGFDRAIAHGMFSYARVLAALGARIPEAGASTVWFRAPVTLPSTTRLTVSPDTRRSVLWAATGDREHLVTTVAPA